MNENSTSQSQLENYENITYKSKYTAVKYKILKKVHQEKRRNKKPQQREQVIKESDLKKIETIKEKIENALKNPEFSIDPRMELMEYCQSIDQRIEPLKSNARERFTRIFTDYSAERLIALLISEKPIEDNTAFGCKEYNPILIPCYKISFGETIRQSCTHALTSIYYPFTYTQAQTKTLIYALTVIASTNTEIKEFLEENKTSVLAARELENELEEDNPSKARLKLILEDLKDK